MDVHALAVRDDGALYLRHPDALRMQDETLLQLLDRCCETWNARPFLLERDAQGAWRGISYADFRSAVERAADGLAHAGVAAGMRVGILSANSIAHAVAAFAVMALGAAAVPLAPAYLAHAGGAALLARLAQAAGVRLLLHDERLELANAWPTELARLPLSQVRDGMPSSASATPLRQRAATVPAQAPAKIFFTSGSTGTPKGVVHTQGMLAAAAAMMDQIGPRLPQDALPVLLDWLPWTHAYGGNMNLHAALVRGASYYIDTGAPLPDRFAQTLRNLGEVQPTEYTTVPAAYPLLLDALELDAELAARFFERLHSCGFGGAALSPAVIERFQRLAVRSCGQRLPLGGGYGMTETCGIIAMVYWITDRGDLLGLPLPGVELKLVPLDDARWECRVRGPQVFTGYLGDADPAGFDEEGFFVTGDAVELADRQQPALGLLFAGRLGEDFKLANGSFVRASRLREALLDQLRPRALDLVILGENRNEVAALVWAADGEDAHEALLQACRAFNHDRRGATERIGRLAVAQHPPEAAAGELTAKGTLNARRIAEHRSEEIHALYTSARCCV